jgi:3-deoxy-D-manno-octulosonic-acid transferase
LHAVSVGEVASALPLLEHLRAGQPRTPIFLSTSTAAGRKAAERQASSLVNGLFYSPIDYVSCIRRTLRAIRPALLVIFETEIWPNLYAETRRSGARIAIVNGRISNRTWPRYKAWKQFFTPILQIPDAVFVQSMGDQERYAELGVTKNKLAVAGNLKYDATVVRSPVYLPAYGAEHIWVAASTVGPNERGSSVKHTVDEDDIVISTFQILAREFPRLLLILAPRQPARFDRVARKLQVSGIHFLRRTHIQADSSAILQLPGVILLDTIGELAGIYSLANVVFVGGSLAPRGGHNILEPAAAGAPIIVGPHMENFEAITSNFLEANALIQIQRPEDLMPAVRALLLGRGGDLGERAKRVVKRHRGASRVIADHLWPIYYKATPKPPHNLLVRFMLRPLAFLWREAGALKRRQSEHRAHSLLPIPAPVVSIGGITVGGSGKTPFTTYLAARLKDYGYAPAILTRGYHRRSPAEYLVFPAGAKAPAAFTGDEAQIFLRTGVAPIGIGANRYRTALILLRQFPTTDILLLDDGFQHAQLERDFDVVVIDGLDPFGQDELVPIGRLREPLEALARAHAFVVTRAEIDLRFQAIASCLRKYNPAAPIFRTRLVTRCWRDYRTGERIPNLCGRRVGAFCGLGNPQNFWETLDSLGLEVVFRWPFPDHHAYKPSELQRISRQARLHGAEILVTTEKDRINCPSHLGTAIAPLDLAWLEIELQLEDEAGFFAVMETALRKRHPAGLAF